MFLMICLGGFYLGEIQDFAMMDFTLVESTRFFTLGGFPGRSSPLGGEFQAISPL
jgi:hypothetical protein